MPLRSKGIVALLAVMGFITWNGVWTIRHFVAEAHCNTVTNSTLNRDQNPPLDEIKKAIEWDRWNSEYGHKLGRELIRIRNAELGNLEQEYEAILERQREVIKALEESVRLNPFKAEYHMRLGWEYAYLLKDPGYHARWLPAADIAMERAAYFAGEKNPYLHVAIGNYWIYRSKTMYSTKSEWDTAWTKAQWHYKKAQSVERSKSLAEEIARYIWKYYPDREFVFKALLLEKQFLLDEIQ